MHAMYYLGNLDNEHGIVISMTSRLGPSITHVDDDIPYLFDSLCACVDVMSHLGGGSCIMIYLTCPSEGDCSNQLPL